MIYLMMIDREDDRQKFRFLYEKYRYLLYKVANDILNDPHLAEDAVQDAYIKIAQNILKIGDVHSYQTKRYLIQIIKTTTIDIYRKKAKYHVHEVLVDEIGEDSMAATHIEAEAEDDLFQILLELPVKFRDVYILKYSGMLENKEIAKVLGISEGNVRQRLLRGKEIIRKELEKRGEYI